MDLGVGAKQVWVMMSLFTKTGSPKLVSQCTYPLTALRCVTRIYTDYGTFLVTEGEVRVRELCGVASVDDLEQRLEIPLLV